MENIIKTVEVIEGGKCLSTFFAFCGEDKWNIVKKKMVKETEETHYKCSNIFCAIVIEVLNEYNVMHFEANLAYARTTYASLDGTKVDLQLWV